ncbi:MAG: DUF5103 domain-containing protein [Bacteroidaceae bacterium]
MRQKSSHPLLGLLLAGLCALAFQPAHAQRHRLFDPQLRTLRVEGGATDCGLPLLRLGTDDVLEISFDELSHSYHRYVYRLTHCNADWTPSDLTEIDYQEGFSPIPVYDSQPSAGSILPYTHYRFRLPDDELRPTRSGNYRLTVSEEDSDAPPVIEVCFAVVDAQVVVSATVSGNTDIDTHATHQQVDIDLRHPDYPIRYPESELCVRVMQNHRWDTAVDLARPTYQQTGRLQYTHCPALIFPAGNEFRRFELTDLHNGWQGVDQVRYFAPCYHATLFTDEPRRRYSFDRDLNGAFVVRSLLAADSDTEADYAFVHFSVYTGSPLPGGRLHLLGDFTYDWFDESTELAFHPDAGCYEGVQLLKLGAYHYLYVFVPDGSSHGLTAPVEGDFSETENEYQVLVYHRPAGEWADRLVGFTTLTTARD